MGYYPDQVDGDVVMGAIESGESLVLQAGRPPVVKVFALPLNKWKGSAAVTERYDLEGAVRVGLSDLTARLIMQIVAAQVDAEWEPSGCAVLTFSGRDVMLLVPANPYWRGLVEGGHADPD